MEEMYVALRIYLHVSKKDDIFRQTIVKWGRAIMGLRAKLPTIFLPAVMSSLWEKSNKGDLRKGKNVTGI